MQIHRDINNLPSFKNAAITIGTFDGVHCGHIKIIDQLKKEASDFQGESVIITFDPHPRMVIKDENKSLLQKVSLLNTLEEKIELIEKQNVDHLVIVQFTEEFSELSAEDYIKKFLVEKFHPKTIIIGYDHHFGRARGGNYKLMEHYGGTFHYTVKEIPQYVLDHVAISSTLIRQAINNADVITANKFLGYDYYFSGTVINGDKIGRTLGYPTANLQVENEYKLKPVNGIYIVEALLENKKLQGIMSIGFRPTIGGTTQNIEVYLLDFYDIIYGKIIKIILKKYIRPELNFPDLHALTQKIKDDEDQARLFFKQQSKS